MKKEVLVVLTFILLVFLLKEATAAIYGITIGDTNFPCGISDGICPSDYAGCQPCADDTTGSTGAVANDPDCCSPMVCTSFWCTAASIVCGDSTTEQAKDETDSEGQTVANTGIEDCYSVGCTSEQVVDNSNDPACLDTVTNSTDSCADDGILFSPYTTTTTCEENVNCRDTDDDGDTELCTGGNWHDPDEAETYCTAVEGTWTMGEGTSSALDDFNGDLTDGYCEGDDGFTMRGAIVAETYRGSSYCEPAIDVTVTIKDVGDTSIIYESTTTTYEETWSEILGCHEISTSNDVGKYTLALRAGTYYLVAEATGYNTVTKNISVIEDATFDAFWLYLNENCQADCTKNDKICYSACEGVNGCTFPTYSGSGESVATYCDGMKKGYRYVLSETTDAESNTVSGDHVYCCNNEPEAYSREYFSAEDAETSCVENVISKSKGIWLNGEWVNLNVVIFSDPMPEKSGCYEYKDFMCEMYGGAFC